MIHFAVMDVWQGLGQVDRAPENDWKRIEYVIFLELLPFQQWKYMLQLRIYLSKYNELDSSVLRSNYKSILIRINMLKYYKYFLELQEILCL